MAAQPASGRGRTILAGPDSINAPQRMKLRAPRVAPAETVCPVPGGGDSPSMQNEGCLVITASITNEAVDELKLAKGQKAHAVIKASDVMIAVD